MDPYTVHKLTKAGLTFDIIQRIGKRYTKPKTTLMVQSQEIHVQHMNNKPLGYIPHTGEYKKARLIFYLEHGCVDFALINHSNYYTLGSGFADATDGHMVDVECALPNDPCVLAITFKYAYPKPKEVDTRNVQVAMGKIFIGSCIDIGSNRDDAIVQGVMLEMW